VSFVKEERFATDCDLQAFESVTECPAHFRLNVHGDEMREADKRNKRKGKAVKFKRRPRSRTDRGTRGIVVLLIELADKACDIASASERQRKRGRECGSE
jgi:hypothetical protein